jgi:hypothetical protein
VPRATVVPLATTTSGLRDLRCQRSSYSSFLLLPPPPPHQIPDAIRYLVASPWPALPSAIHEDTLLPARSSLIALYCSSSSSLIQYLMPSGIRYFICPGLRCQHSSSYRSFLLLASPGSPTSRSNA